MVSGRTDPQRLRVFLNALVVLALFFSALELFFGVELGIHALDQGALCLGLVIAAAISSRLLLANGRTVAAVLALALALDGYAVVQSILLPFGIPSFALVPFLALAASLPFVSGAALNAVLGGAFVTVTAVGVVSATAPPMDRAPHSVQVALLSLGMAANALLIIYMLLQWQRQARSTVEQTLASNERLAFLSRATQQLGASLDYEKTLEQVARLIVPTLGDACIVDLLEDDGQTYRRVAEAASTAEREELVRRLRAYPPSEARPSTVLKARQTMSTVVLEHLDDRQLRALSGTIGDYVSIVQALGQRLSVTVPLICSGRFLGAITFGSSMRATCAPGEVQLAEELASRAALAVDNALSFRRARQAIETRDEFLSIAAHELRTPLTALKLRLQSLERSTHANAPEKLKAAHRQLNRLGNLVEQLLDLSRLEAGRFELSLSDVDLKPLLTEVAAPFVDEAAAAGFELRLSVPEGLWGSWDRIRVEQVLTNLLSNAVKYGRQKPIDVIAERRGDQAVIAIVDRGIGIAQKDLSRLFGRFERAVPARHYGGLGLGLFISRQIADALGGSITVVSHEGEGSRFELALPLAPPPAARDERKTA